MKKLLAVLVLSTSFLAIARQPKVLLVVDPHKVISEATKVPGNFLNGRNNLAIAVDGKVVAQTCHGQLPFQLDDCQHRFTALLEQAIQNDLLIAIDPQEQDLLPALTNLHVTDLK